MNRIQECNSTFDQFVSFTLTFTPRAVTALFCGYYSLGVAYATGLMAAIDKIAISILIDQVGYVGIGVFMPTFQWYSAWTVRVLSAVIGTLLYDLVEKTIKFVWHWFFSKNDDLIPDFNI